MGVFDKILGDWIQVVDDKCEITIDNYGYDTGIIKGTTGNHCAKCVSVNKCWFKNEKGKNPEKFELSGKVILDAIVNGLPFGLYHLKCHCKEEPVYLENVDKIQLIIPDGKINYLFKSKADWVNSMGYYENDYRKFVEILLETTKKAYFDGNYNIVNHTKYGCKINLNINIPGINDKSGKVYKIKTNYMIFPNGKLKMNTPIGGWQK